jgi:archaemetzincin
VTRKGPIYLIRLGAVDIGIVEGLQPRLQTRFGLSCVPGKPIENIDFAYSSQRRQYLSTAILRNLSESRPADAIRVLGVAGVDLFVPRLNFVFGEAVVGGNVAVISLYRLDPLRYGEPANRALFRERALKEAIHELGHTFGLAHCGKPSCVMSFSNSLQDTDRKRSRFCPSCQSLLPGR